MRYSRGVSRLGVGNIYLYYRVGNMKYNPSKIEKKWQKYWEKNKIFKDYSRKDKFYVLDMFPYPSGSGLHVGHPKGYIATDITARYQQMRGKSVLHPMGWDAFGLPTENYAIKNKIHPSIATAENVRTFKGQLEKIGFTYDWDREINTTDPEYYKWTQWIFLQLFEKGLAYESYEPINWCPSCKTGLANEDLDNGKCERCGSEVEQRPMRQWVLKMTDYADRLLEDLDTEGLDWEKSIVDQQKNWIGRSYGTSVKFKIKSGEASEEYIEVFTTRVDTIFSAAFLIVAPEHAVILDFKSQISNLEEIEAYIEQAKKKTVLQRTDLAKEKTGVELKGVKVINPANEEEISVWVSDFVLGDYGTGAVFADVHDERDFEFAKKYNIPLKVSIRPEDDASWEDVKSMKICFSGDGVLIDSGEFTGLTSQEARENITDWLEKTGSGKRTVKYKMRDWVFSRQRYWGEPIPIVHCEKCGAVGVPEEQLPVALPEVESYEPTGTGESPLAGISEWVNTTCPKCGGPAKRETNTMPQWAGSSWYYLRYIDAKNDHMLIDPALEKKWMPVDLYVGGAEHATRHLLYARFWHKFLYDIGVVSTKEPFKKLVHVGLINAADGRKMSKRWNNVINPDDVIAEFGADSLRLYEMFMGPFTQNISWNTEGVSGVRRFLEKVWRLFERVESEERQVTSKNGKEIESLIHKTIKKVTEDIEAFRFNTAVSSLMILVNVMEKEESLSKESYTKLIVLLSPFAPHIAEELWKKLGNTTSIFLEQWLTWDERMIVDETITMVVQVNGKVRDQLVVSADITEEDAREAALASEKVQRFVDGKEVRKVIFVKGKLVSIAI